MRNEVKKCPTCQKPNAFSLSYCNSCGENLSHVPVEHTNNVFAGFIYGIRKGPFPFTISMRSQTEDTLVFDDLLAMTPCHLNVIPSDVYLPNFISLLRHPKDAIELLDRLWNAAFKVVQDQFCSNPDWCSKTFRDPSIIIDDPTTTTTTTTQHPHLGVPSTSAGGWGSLQLLGGVLSTSGPSSLPEKSEGEAGKKLSKAQRKRAATEHEAHIREVEKTRREGGRAPQSAAEFEAAVVASPDSSLVWLQYMAFCVKLGDVTAAREVAERALKGINYREEQERFNVWSAYVNLETAYGSEEAASKLLQRALQYTDARKMYRAAISSAQKLGKVEFAEQLLQAQLKRFKGEQDAWLEVFEFLLQQGRDDDARQLTARALQSLPKAQHTALVAAAALKEFRYGSAERGRSMLEGALRNAPRRLDLWSVYLDQEIKLGDQPRTRALFERVTQLSLPPRKMKFLFKRWLDYEKQHGDDGHVDGVKRAAMEYVQSLGQ